MCASACVRVLCAVQRPIKGREMRWKAKSRVSSRSPAQERRNEGSARGGSDPRLTPNPGRRRTPKPGGRAPRSLTKPLTGHFFPSSTDQKAKRVKGGERRERESEDGEFWKTHRLLSSAQVSRGAAAGQELAAQWQLLLHRGRGQVTSAWVCVTSSISFSSRVQINVFACCACLIGHHTLYLYFHNFHNP